MNCYLKLFATLHMAHNGLVDETLESFSASQLHNLQRRAWVTRSSATHLLLSEGNVCKQFQKQH